MPDFNRTNRVPITIGILLATVMSALDTTVVNVALRLMEGNLSASPEQITWVLTSYIIAVAVITLVSGWLVAQLASNPCCWFALPDLPAHRSCAG